MAYVYILRHGETNYFKIGRTRGDIDKRIKTLSTGNPKQLSLFDFIETKYDNLVENFLHKKFHHNLSKEGDSKEFYVISEIELREGLTDAEEFLREFLELHEVIKEHKNHDSNGIMIEPNDEVLSIYQELRKIRGELSLLEFEKTILENRLKTKILENDGIEGIATWRTQTSSKFDRKSFKEKHPDLAEEFSRKTKMRTLRIL